LAHVFFQKEYLSENFHSRIDDFGILVYEYCARAL
jgi:hypothetical protein